MSVSWIQRAVVLATVLITPLLCYLARNRYNPLRPEALLAIAVLLVICGVLTSLSRVPAVFFGFVAVIIALDCATLPGSLIGSTIAPFQGFALCLVGSVLASVVFQEKLLRVIIAAAIAVYGGAILTYLPGSEAAGLAQPAGKAPLPHVLYVVLDEHLGAGAFPQDIPACASASRAVADVFALHQFTLHPNAYSNYAITLDSLPSVFNRMLLPHSHNMVDQAKTGSRSYALKANALCETMRQRGLAVSVCQHRSIDLHAGSDATHLDYEDVLGNLQDVESGWLEKSRWIIGGYQASDPVLQRVNGFFPFRLGGRTTGPLGIKGLWPRRVSQQIQAARRPTLFLVHLLIPHGPYLYRKDGSVRRLEEWSGDRADRRLEVAQYREHYSRYCEQVEHLSSQLDTLFGQLRQAGSWDAMSVVVHGDHGSRIRQRLPGMHANVSAERYDYGNANPSIRDLLDRFSTLMARKPAHQLTSHVVAERESPAADSGARFLRIEPVHCRYGRCLFER